MHSKYREKVEEKQKGVRRSARASTARDSAPAHRRPTPRRSPSLALSLHQSTSRALSYPRDLALPAPGGRGRSAGTGPGSARRHGHAGPADAVLEPGRRPCGGRCRNRGRVPGGLPVRRRAAGTVAAPADARRPRAAVHQRFPVPDALRRCAATQAHLHSPESCFTVTCESSHVGTVNVTDILTLDDVKVRPLPVCQDNAGRLQLVGYNTSGIDVVRHHPAEDCLLRSLELLSGCDVILTAANSAGNDTIMAMIYTFDTIMMNDTADMQ